MNTFEEYITWVEDTAKFLDETSRKIATDAGIDPSLKHSRFGHQLANNLLGEKGALHPSSDNFNFHVGLGLNDSLELLGKAGWTITGNEKDRTVESIWNNRQNATSDYYRLEDMNGRASLQVFKDEGNVVIYNAENDKQLATRYPNIKSAQYWGGKKETPDQLMRINSRWPLNPYGKKRNFGTDLSIYREEQKLMEQAVVSLMRTLIKSKVSAIFDSRASIKGCVFNI